MQVHDDPTAPPPPGTDRPWPSITTAADLEPLTGPEWDELVEHARDELVAEAAALVDRDVDLDGWLAVAWELLAAQRAPGMIVDVLEATAQAERARGEDGDDLG